MNAKNKKSTVWQGATGTTPSELNIQYCAGRDVRGTEPADQRLLPYDIWLNMAHVVMLLEQKIVPRTAGKKILLALDELDTLAAKNEFTLDPDLEDVHTNVEAFVSGRHGEDVGGYIHTARSRNDQVATDMRLFMRDWILAFGNDVIECLDEVVDCAFEHLDSLMPGFTHYQPATPTTLAHWLCSYVFAQLRDLRRLFCTLDLMDECPLGAAASFGTSWPIDRSRTAELLGFSLVQTNTLDCVRSRGEIETQLVSALAQAMRNFANISQDLIILGSLLGIVKIDPAFTTGSSMMPQKRNLDFAEVTKAKAAAIYGSLQSLLAGNSGNLSGYNRDSQWTKYLLMDALDEARLAPAVFKGVFETLAFNKKKARAALQVGFLESADLANYLAQNEGIPFRITYRIVGRAVQLSHKTGRLSRANVNRALKEEGLKGSISAAEWKRFDSTAFLVEHKTHIGGPAPSAVEAELVSLRVRLDRKRSFLKKHSRRIKAARNLTIRQASHWTGK